jgi:opacity protein-like surface antigen
MTRWFLLLLVGTLAAPIAFGQDNEPKRYEFYGGYAYQRANNNADTFDRNGQASLGGLSVDLAQRSQGYHGFNAEFNQNVTRHIGLVTSVVGTYSKAPYVSAVTGTPLSASASRYDVMFGPRYNLRMGTFNPFAEALFGFEHMRVNFAQPLTNSPKADTAFAMAFGGGLDVHVSEHFDIRAIQADYVPTFYNGTSQPNYRVGAGVKVKFGQDP